MSESACLGKVGGMVLLTEIIANLVGYWTWL